MGLWVDRYKELRPHLLVLSPLEQEQLARFCCLINVFINPTFRAQALYHTLAESVLSGFFCGHTICQRCRLSDFGVSYLLHISHNCWFAWGVFFFRILEREKEYSWWKGGCLKQSNVAIYCKKDGSCSNLFLCLSREANVKANSDYWKDTYFRGIEVGEAVLSVVVCVSATANKL